MTIEKQTSMARFVRPHIARMAGYVPGEQPQGGGFTKLNTNENPYPPSPRVKRRSSSRSATGFGFIPIRWRLNSAARSPNCTGSSLTWCWRAMGRTTS